MAVRIEAHSEPIPGYKLLERLGAGGFGEVWKAEAPGGIFKAIKIIHGDLRSKDNDLVRYAEQELKSLKRVQQVRHPYLLALDRYDIVDGRLMITMELADCNLWDRFREFRSHGLPGIPRDDLLIYMAETAEVLDLFNDQFQLQHLDIKPQNLFLLYNHIKVADFGQVKDLQGLQTTVTGGITPVYAAPETFEGHITRFCDQYSLACVYQELLTGIRPFDGSSMSQLLMQHLNLQPNLNPSPVADRPVLARALAKKPEDRWPNVLAFVRALLGSDPVPVLSKTSSTTSVASASKSAPDLPTAFAPDKRPAPPESSIRPPSVSLPRLVVPGSNVLGGTDPSGENEAGQIFAPIPSESLGPGPLRPALVIGLGQVGLRVLQRFRFELTERHGPPEMTPVVRTLFIDTDQTALDEASKHRPNERLAALRPDMLLHAKLQRPVHYAKARSNGRPVTDGWLDHQMVFKIPQDMRTLGLRAFGRLAFCDHYRSVMAKVQTELDTALSATSLVKTEARTGLARRTNRPRVYIVAGLCGATGGGMFIDLAYSVRYRLTRMGYENPEIYAVLVVPAADAALTQTQALGNTYAALTELNHYSRPDTAFLATFDDRHGTIHDTAPPFSRCFLIQAGATGLNLPPPAVLAARAKPAGSGSIPQAPPRTSSQRASDPIAIQAGLRPYGIAADLIRLNLFTLVGRGADTSPVANTATETESSTETPAPGVNITAFGLAGFGWPRSEVVTRTSRKVAQLVLKRWALKDHKRVTEIIPALAEEKWTQLHFDPETVRGRLQLAADIAGENVEEKITAYTEPLVPRGWLARLPDPTSVVLAIEQLLGLLGAVGGPKRAAPPVELAMNKAVQETSALFNSAVKSLVPSLINDPRLRVAGTEEMLRQLLAATDRLIIEFTQAAGEHEGKAQAGFEKVSGYAYYHKERKKPTTAEFGEAIKQYPRFRFQALICRSLAAAYQALRDALAPRLAEVEKARTRLAELAQRAESSVTLPEPVGGVPRLMPAGCTSVAEAVERFYGVVTEVDLSDIDQRVQKVIEPEFGGVLQACLSAEAGPEAVVATVYEESRAHLDVRLGRVDLAGMFAERFRTPEHAEQAIEQTYQEAEPIWVGGGPWRSTEVTVVGCPHGSGGEPLMEIVERAIPASEFVVADTPDDLLVYREWPKVPLGALPQLGPAAQAACQAIEDTLRCTPHTRLEVPHWMGVDEV